MAVTSYGVNDALAVKAWSKKLAYEALKATAIAPLIGTSMDSVIIKKTELQKGPGDKITCGLRTQLSQQSGVSESQILEGNEASLTTYSDALFINEIAHAVRVKNNGTIDVQRVPFNLRSEANMALKDWYADRMSLMFFLQVCGYNAPTITFEGETITLNSTHWGFNSVTAPSSNRHIWAGSASDDQSLTSSDTFTLDLIDYAVEKAKTANPKVRPIRIGGEKKYVMYLHPYQVTSLRTNTSTGQWLDITKAIYQGSRANNPIYDGSLGEYNGVILRESEHVTPGVDTSDTSLESDVRRAVLLGAGAGYFAIGKQGKETSFSMVEKTFDYDRELGVAVKNVMGMKKSVFNSEDFGTVVVSSYASAAA